MVSMSTSPKPARVSGRGCRGLVAVECRACIVEHSTYALVFIRVQSDHSAYMFVWVCKCMRVVHRVHAGSLDIVGGQGPRCTLF